MIGTGGRRDRAVSISVTHALTIGITTILIAMLLMSSSTMLEAETDRSVESSLETIGERLADEVGNVDQMATENGSVTVTTEHPARAASSRYTVELKEEGSCDARLIDSTDCLKLTAHSTDVVVHVPIKIDSDIDSDQKSAAGGTIEIHHDDSGISIEEVN